MQRVGAAVGECDESLRWDAEHRQVPRGLHGTAHRTSQLHRLPPATGQLASHSDQCSHSLAYRKFQDPEAFFQDPVKRSRVRLPAVPLSGNNLWQVVHTRASVTKLHCHQCTGQGAVMPCGYEGNRRSGVALAVRHRFKSGLSTCGSWPCQGVEHSAYAVLWSMAHLPLPVISQYRDKQQSLTIYL